MTRPFYAGEFQTKEEWDQKVKYLTENINNRHFTDDQKVEILVTIKKFEKYREGLWFEYKGHDCCVTLDDYGKWRIYTKPLQDEAMPYDVETGYDDYYMSNDSSFGLDKFPLMLWNYGDKVGLDDFIGVSVLSEYSWKDYFEGRPEHVWELRRRGIIKSRIKIVRRESMVKLCKFLVDCIIAYQKNNRFVNTQLKNEAESHISTIKQKVYETFEQMDNEGLVLLVKKLDKFRSDLN